MKTIIVVLVTLVLSITGTVLGQGAVRVGDMAPDFTLFDTDGNQFKLSSKRGNVIVLFWMGFS